MIFIFFNANLDFPFEKFKILSEICIWKMIFALEALTIETAEYTGIRHEAGD